MKTARLRLMVRLFRLRVGADVNTLAFRSGRLNSGAVDKNRTPPQALRQKPPAGIWYQVQKKSGEKQQRGRGLGEIKGLTGGCI